MTIDELIKKWEKRLECRFKKEGYSDYCQGERDQLLECIKDLKQLKEKEDDHRDK